ncbi:MAG TPA: hypothetical protein DGZ24_01255 [Rhodospirillaceae bacterium]|nr:hypothetical protein [Rhodospirillaceae bacterium]
MTHRQIIEALGGTTNVANLFGLATQNISNWKRRGIPHKYRNKVAVIAMMKKVRLPDNFFEAA